MSGEWMDSANFRLGPLAYVHLMIQWDLILIPKIPTLAISHVNGRMCDFGTIGI